MESFLKNWKYEYNLILWRHRSPDFNEDPNQNSLHNYKKEGKKF